MEHAAETCRVQCAFKEKDRAESVSASKLPSYMNTVVILVMSSYSFFSYICYAHKIFSKDLTQTFRGECVWVSSFALAAYAAI